MAHVGIIGAGLSGLMAARRLHGKGVATTVFDKGRGPGGRASTRRVGPFQFDHGAQYFTVREPTLAAEVEGWRRAGVVAPWEPRWVELERGRLAERAPVHRRYVGTPSMSALARHLAQGLDVRTSAQVMGLEAGTVILADGTRHGPFDAVLLTPPPPQTLALVQASVNLRTALEPLVPEPCWALMVGFPQPLELGFDAASLSEGPLAWIAREASKPGRPAVEAITVHAGAAWSCVHLEDSPEQVAPLLLRRLEEALSRRLPEPEQLIAHRWRFARPLPLGTPVLTDPERRWVVAGDALLGGNVEGAVLSGAAAAEAMLRGLL